MKIILSQKEVTDIVLNHFNLAPDTQVIISRPRPISVPDSLQTIIREVDSLLKAGLKIDAIKHFRNHNAGMGLIDAKYAVENWEAVKAWVNHFGRLPARYINGSGNFELN